GGRLDATNIVQPVAAAITSIDFDHQAQLGSTLESIAFEKAGVIKRGIPVVCGNLPAEAERVIRRVCEEQSARFVRVSECGTGVALSRAARLALPGEHQRANAAVAVCLMRQLDALGIRIEDTAVDAGLRDVQWPGRLELLEYHGTEFLLDAAHNPAGARALAGYLREAGWTGSALVFGAMKDKDVAAMLAELAPVSEAIVCTTAASPRALPAAALADVARTVPGASWSVSAVPDPADAARAAAQVHRRVVIAGSIFLIGPLRGILRAP
ncbi:MAG: bifunctional folylpolyglutamate synthase/dihydrofolate synthase, partial [Vicinamibacterales bacterium]